MAFPSTYLKAIHDQLMEPNLNAQGNPGIVVYMHNNLQNDFNEAPTSKAADRLRKLLADVADNTKVPKHLRYIDHVIAMIETDAGDGSGEQFGKTPGEYQNNPLPWCQEIEAAVNRIARRIKAQTSDPNNSDADPVDRSLHNILDTTTNIRNYMPYHSLGIFGVGGKS